MQKGEKYWRQLPEGTITFKITANVQQMPKCIEILKSNFKGKFFDVSPILKTSNDSRYYVYVNVLPSEE